MTIEYICRSVKKLMDFYEQRDPFELAQEMGVIVLLEPMGSSEDSCKGFFLYQSRQRVIVVNSDLPYHIQRIILAHEIGHSVLHKDIAKFRAFNDFALYSSASQCEYEANIFAAEYLLEDSSVLEALNEDDFFFSTAKNLNVPAELLDFKFRILKHKGYKLKSPIFSKSTFLKHI